MCTNMGTALRKLSAQGKLGGRGAGKLTAAKCKSLQNYYRYRKAEEHGVTPESHNEHAGSLTKEVGKKLIPLYHRMSSDSLLQRMQPGGTQNANECLNSVIWSRCTKTVFVGKKRVEAAASLVISTFNKGASAMLSVMDRLWLETTEVTVSAIKSADKLWIVKADSLTSACAKYKRRSCDRQKGQKTQARA